MNESYETAVDHEVQEMASEQPFPSQAEHVAGDHVGAGMDSQTPGTGHVGVDEVLASLTELDEAEVSQHVAVFERAHSTLRAILNDATASSQA